MSLAIQYTIVALIILGACLYMIRGVIRKRKAHRRSCEGCDMASCCKNPDEKIVVEKSKPHRSCCDN